MLAVSKDPRAELAALCERGLDWQTHTTRLLANPAAARRAAVLVLFGVLDAVPARAASAAGASRVPADLDVLLLRRAATLGSHPGQIAFPGGRLEPTDSGPIAAALREAVEETGLDADGLEPLGVLPDLAVPVSNHIVTPVPAWWTHRSDVAAVDHAETVDVFRLPVADLLDPANRASTEHTVAGTTYRAPAFTVDGRLVWGFTAIVLSRMFDELDWAVAWNKDRVVRPEL
ncbi:NUDIX hydrolase [Cryobacterium arcticum]|uniref:Coenzyme A pyrophosphatase n=1 Tax=Cryobacterium arcticum TaxID=670052 RepID=A0A317ZR47_9MICO|nr:CoA pyrophosphatase [Cryobacterium arcticum]PXA67225.1 coenzyme A pyrophosphatase [Cryobacterium arcticum]